MSTVDSSGTDAASSSAELASATATGRRMTPRASRYQPPDSSETDGPRRTDHLLIRVPSSARIDGTTRIAVAAESSPTAAPAAPTE